MRYSAPLNSNANLPMENLEARLNSFASRCFRDVADRDYISARMCYRAGLISQFHWAALQAFEKYYKAILLYNRIKAKNVRHDLSLAQKHAEKAPSRSSSVAPHPSYLLTSTTMDAFATWKRLTLSMDPS